VDERRPAVRRRRHGHGLGLTPLIFGHLIRRPRIDGHLTLGTLPPGTPNMRGPGAGRCRAVDLFLAAKAAEGAAAKTLEAARKLRLGPSMPGTTRMCTHVGADEGTEWTELVCAPVPWLNQISRSLDPSSGRPLVTRRRASTRIMRYRRDSICPSYDAA
jgi:hypothetical protein